MKRIFYSITAIFVLMALLASCAVSVEDANSKQEQLNAQPASVGFGVYMKRGTTTKAGYAGELTTEVLKRDTVGFGVFSYYGNGALYNEASKPDFMYNQLVKFTSNNVWEYSPIKYWPNEFGAQAGSESADRLTFFAYAPYVEVTPSTGIVTGDTDYGIIGMSRNIAEGDPMVMYSAKLQTGYGGVDLCWGVAANNFTSSVDGDNNNVQKGDPYLNLIKPKTGDRLMFEFNHALTQLNVQIDTDVDVESGETNPVDSKTKVYIRSISFTGFTTRGSLNLNSKAGKPLWYNITGTGRLSREPVTIYDGRSDGLEGVATASDISEIPATLNPKLIQSVPYGPSNAPTVGVTNTKENLFAYASLTSDPVPYTTDVAAPVMVIPIFGVPVTVTIVYDVETIDDNLASFLSDGVTHGVSTENKITKTIQMNGQDMTLESGKKYVIGLHLGLTSVKFDATVAEWDDAQYEGEAYLPINTGGSGPYTATSYNVNNEASWNAAYNAPNSPLKAYLDANPDEDRWNEHEQRWAVAADKVSGQWPDYCVQCWKGAINAPNAKYPWVTISLPIPFDGKIELIYDGGTPIYPWGTEVHRTNGYGVASIPEEFGRTDWIIDPSTGEAPADGTPNAFDPSKLVVNLYYE